MTPVGYNDAINSHLPKQKKNALCQVDKVTPISYSVKINICITHKSSELHLGLHGNICEILSSDMASLFIGYMPNSIFCSNLLLANMAHL